MANFGTYGVIVFFFSSRRRHTRFDCDWSSDVCSSDLDRPIRSIAVLPLQCLNSAAEDRYLSIGIADVVITRVAASRQVVVRPTSAMGRFSGDSRDPLAAGKELHVDAVLDGKIQVSNDAIRATAQLIRVADAKMLWTATFDE